MKLKEEVWLHIPTMTTACVIGNVGMFQWDGRHEESYWGLFRQEERFGWVYICDLNEEEL